MYAYDFTGLLIPGLVALGGVVLCGSLLAVLLSFGGGRRAKDAATRSRRRAEADETTSAIVKPR